MSTTATVSNDSNEKGEISPRSLSRSLDENPWLEYALDQFNSLSKSLRESSDLALDRARSRLSEIRYTTFVHLDQTLEDLEIAKAQFKDYEKAFFWKIREGLAIAASHPEISCGVAAGLGFFVFRRPRRFLFHKVQTVFLSEESLISRADARVKELRKAVDNVKFESKVLEDNALRAQEEMVRGRTKLRQAGRQIQGVIHSAHKIERQAMGLKDALGELPLGEVSRLRQKVSALASEAKKQKGVLVKEVTKITNHGISI